MVATSFRASSIGERVGICFVRKLCHPNFIHHRVLALVQSLSIDPISEDLNAVSDLSESMAFDVRKLHEVAYGLSTEDREPTYATDDGEDGEVSFHVPRTIALWSRLPMDD